MSIKKQQKKLLRKGMKAPFQTKAIKYSKRDIFALIFSLLSVSLFIITSVYILVDKESIVNMLVNQDFPQMTPYLPLVVSILAFIWILFAVIMSIAIYKIEKKEWKWYSLLIISILSLITLKIDSFICGFIASLLYIKNHR